MFGNFYLSRIYGRLGFSYVWFGAFFLSLVISFIGDMVFIWFVRKGGVFHERDDVNDCLYVHSLFCMPECISLCLFDMRHVLG